jgi:D-alanyl-D-alanine-carboxypeptidase/D-alanyl-D-alanine-endopeptidase
MQIGLAWIIQSDHDREIVWHNGETGGYYSFIGFDRESRTGVVVLSNSSLPIQDIGIHLSEPGFPLTEFIDPAVQIQVAPEVFDTYVGRYELAPEFILTIFRDAEKFYVQATGQSPIEIVAQTETRFVAPVVNGAVEFGHTEGKVDHLIMSQGGTERRAERIGDDVGDVQAPPTEIAVPQEVLEGYVGEYQLTPQFVLSVTLGDTGLLIQATGQGALPIFATSETELFYKAVPARVTFTVDAEGKATKLTLHQGGRDMPATRLEGR